MSNNEEGLIADDEESSLLQNDENNDEDRTDTTIISRSAKRSLGIGLSLLAGLFYGVTFVPVIYIQDHKEDVSLDLFKFNHKILVFSSIIHRMKLSHMPFHIIVEYI